MLRCRILALSALACWAFAAGCSRDDRHSEEPKQLIIDQSEDAPPLDEKSASDKTLDSKPIAPFVVARDQAANLSELEAVFGTDSRAPVQNTLSYPFTAIGQIGSGCTGTLIGDRYVLTAGHCLYDADKHQWYTNLSFAPARSGNVSPFGVIAPARVYITEGYASSGDSRQDFGLIVLSQAIGQRTGWLGVQFQNSLAQGTRVWMAGYPADKPAGTMWASTCQTTYSNLFSFLYPCDTNAGMSGSAVFTPGQNGYAYVIGVHRGTDAVTGILPLNQATLLNGYAYYYISRWMAGYQY